MKSIPKFDKYACPGDALRWSEGEFDFVAHLQHDQYADPPWENSDMHGPVSGWVPLYCEESGRMHQSWIVSRDRSMVRLYDHHAALKKALKDGWWPRDATPDLMPEQLAERAVFEDFEHLRAWCNDEWFYGAVTVEVYSEGTHLAEAALHGIDINAGENNDWISTDVLPDLVEQAMGDAKAQIDRLFDAHFERER